MNRTIGIPNPKTRLEITGGTLISERAPRRRKPSMSRAGQFVVLVEAVTSSGKRTCLWEGTSADEAILVALDLWRKGWGRLSYPGASAPPGVVMNFVEGMGTGAGRQARDLR